MKKTLIEPEYVTDESDDLAAFVAERPEESDPSSEAARGDLPTASFGWGRLARPASLVGSALAGAAFAALILQRSGAPVLVPIPPAPASVPVAPSEPSLAVPPRTPSSTPAPSTTDVERRISPDGTRVADAPPSRPSAVADVPASTPAESAQIEGALGRYRSAVNALDVGAVMEVWPTVNAETLRKAFDQLQAQDVSFERCQIGIKGPRAEAACTGAEFYVPRAGSRTAQVDRRHWRFSLLRVNDEWLIEGVDTR
jgi:hypothetical protein